MIQSVGDVPLVQKKYLKLLQFIDQPMLNYAKQNFRFINCEYFLVL